MTAPSINTLYTGVRPPGKFPSVQKEPFVDQAYIPPSGESPSTSPVTPVAESAIYVYGGTNVGDSFVLMLQGVAGTGFPVIGPGEGPSMQFLWYKDNVALGQPGGFTSGFPAYFIESALESDSGDYKCIIRGAGSASATLTTGPYSTFTTPTVTVTVNP